jgi:hypothetical protein
MNTMLNKISSELYLQNITFEPENQRVRCLAHVINLAAKKAIENLHVMSYEDEMSFIEVEDTEENLKSIIFKVNLL